MKFHSEDLFQLVLYVWVQFLPVRKYRVLFLSSVAWRVWCVGHCLSPLWRCPGHPQLEGALKSRSGILNARLNIARGAVIRQREVIFSTLCFAWSCASSELLFAEVTYLVVGNNMSCSSFTPQMQEWRVVLKYGLLRTREYWVKPRQPPHNSVFLWRCFLLHLLMRLLHFLGACWSPASGWKDSVVMRRGFSLPDLRFCLDQNAASLGWWHTCKDGGDSSTAFCAISVGSSGGRCATPRRCSHCYRVGGKQRGGPGSAALATQEGLICGHLSLKTIRVSCPEQEGKWDKCQ